MSGAANLVIAAAYLGVAFIVARGMWRTGQPRSDRLALVTALIFLSVAVHHAIVGLVTPADWPWTLIGWDVAGAAVAVAYLWMRGSAADAGLFEDVRARERHALEINDNIVQGLARVKWALEAQDARGAERAADETLAEAQKMVTDLLMADSPDGVLSAGRLRREAPAGAASGP